MRDKDDFLHEDKHKVFYKLTVSFLLAIARYVQGTPNSKFLISLQYLKNEGRDEVDFLHANKHQTFLPVDPTNLDEHGQAFPQFSKKQVCKISVIYWESSGWSWIFLQISIRRFYKLMLLFLLGMAKAFKMKSMQYLCNISRKNRVMKSMFCMLMNMKKVFYKLILLFLMGLDRHVQSTWTSLQCLCGILRTKLGMELGT